MQCSDHIGSEPLLGSHFGRPNKTIHLRDVSCKVTEETLKDCKKSFIPFSIGSSSDYKSIAVVGVSCAGSPPSNGSVNPTPGSPGSPGSPSPGCIPKANVIMPLENCTNGDVHLQGTNGQNTREGRLEYCYNRQWSPFCTLDIKTAGLACQKLGFPNGIAIFLLVYSLYSYILVFSSCFSFQ